MKRKKPEELLFERLKNDPVFHVEEAQGVNTLEPYQRDILEAVLNHERVVVKSCHAMGKTFIAARVVLWFTSVFANSKVVTTAPTGRQVRLLLWNEIRAGHASSRYPLGGKMDTMQWTMDPNWWAVGFTTQKEAATGQGQANSGFQGVHGEYVLVIFDEATGVQPDIWKQLEGLLTSANVRFLGIGNPTTKSSQFFPCFSDPSYKKIHLSCFMSPNLRANGIADMAALEAEVQYVRELPEDRALARLEGYVVVQSQLVTAKWVVGRAIQWGLAHPLFVSKCLGDFPEDEERCLMPLGAVERAQSREFDTSTPVKRVSIGVDVARFGTDKSVITPMHGVNVHQPETLFKRDTSEVAGRVIRYVNDLPDELRRLVTIVVDATGIGAGVEDNLRQYQNEHPHDWRGIHIYGLHFGETFKEGRDGHKSQVEERSELYANKKAEAFVLLSEDLKSDLVLPAQSDFYLEQLPTIIYKFDSKGRYVIEDKESYKKRTGLESPDHADSLALANFGRYYGMGSGEFTEKLAQISATRPHAPSLNSGDQW